MKQNKIIDLIYLIRPRQWIKNSFVFVGFIFGEYFHSYDLFFRVFAAAVAFSLISSFIYVINDIVDCENDRNHPKKKERPIPAGKVTVPCALGVAGILLILGFSISFWISYKVSLILLLYGLVNIVYSYRLKNVVIADVFCISFGFMLRILAGTVGVGIPPSKWLLLCGMMITLFLGFAKRRAEVVALMGKKEEHRKVLRNYTTGFLDQMISVCLSGVIMTYSLYAMNEETIKFHKTNNLIYTVPFVVYGLFRYLFLLHHCRMGGDPTKDLMTDRHIVGVVFCWACLIIGILIIPAAFA